MKKIYTGIFLRKVSFAHLWCVLLLAGATFSGSAAGKIKIGYRLEIAERKDTVEVSGKVTDVYGKPLVDVLVQIKSRPGAVRTDLDGWYSLNAEPGDSLVFSLVSFNVKKIAVEAETTINVSLEESHTIPDHFNVLYGTRKKIVNVGAVSEVYTNDLTKTIVSPIAGTFAGRLTGLMTGQNSGEPGADNLSLALRGRDPLILLDGVAQSFSSINPEQVESVTILKDAVSLAMLGVRAANGAVLIKTKQGVEGPQKISFTALGGISRPTYLPHTLNAYQYATLYNEALGNEGRPAVYSQQALDAYRTGSDPIRYPDVNWQDEILKNQSGYNRYNLAINGGKQVAKYFVNLDYLNQPGFFKTSEENKIYNTNASLKRYILRSNVQLDLSEYITTNLNLFGRVQDLNEPGGGTASVYNNTIMTPANAFPIRNSDGTFAAAQDFRYNLYAQNFESGYLSSNIRDFRIDLDIKGKLDKITPGLWVKTSATINSYVAQNINRSKAPALFYEYINPQGDTTYVQYATVGDQQNGVSVGSQNRVFYTEVSMGYSGEINDHHIDAVLLANNDFRQVNGDLAYNIRGISGKVSYDYMQKYVAELAFAYNGSPERYPKGHNYGFFPAIGFAWNLIKEDFLKSQTLLTNLKLRTSYGHTGDFTNAGYYAYNQYYDDRSPGYNFGDNPGAVPGVFQSTIANTSLTWEKANKFNVGVDIGLFKNKLSLAADYFNDKYYDLLQPIGTNTSITGINYSNLNIGKNRYFGSEFELTWHDRKGDFGYFISPNVSFVNSKVLFQDEVSRLYAYQVRTGLPVGQTFGYIAEGLFTSADEIQNSATPSDYAVVPGDIKYKDLNNDGIIDVNDQTAIGTQKPLVYYGINLGASFKGFDFSALLQGMQNREVYLSGTSYWEFEGGHGQAYEHHLQRWTPETASTATYPRLTVGSNRNNSATSTYWIRSGNYMRLKSVELGYNFPASFVRNIRLSGLRLFVNGTNLLTFSDLDNMDPENYWNNYPIQKMLNVGVNVKF